MVVKAAWPGVDVVASFAVRCTEVEGDVEGRREIEVEA